MSNFWEYGAFTDYICTKKDGVEDLELLLEYFVEPAFFAAFCHRRKHIQLTLVISTSLISNNRLFRSGILVLV